MDNFGQIGGPFWSNGPAPGQFYNFPGNSSTGMGMTAPNSYGSKRDGGMITTGTSVIGVKYEGGVIIAADNLVSYGNMARFQNVERVVKINDKTMIGIGGDYADFQFIKRHIDQLVINDEALGDKNELKPKSLFTYLTRVFYNRRSRMQPLWLDVVVGGIQDNEPFLGHVSVRGKSYESNCVGTGFGNHLALPLFREYVENPSIKMNREQGEQLVKKCMEVLYYRDCRAFSKYTQGICTVEGVEVNNDHVVAENWQVAHLIRGY